MSSIRDRIVDDIYHALSADDVSRPANLSTTRHRTKPISRDRLPEQCVYIISEDVSTGPGFASGPDAMTKRTMVVRIESRVDAGGDTTPDEALDPLLTWAVKQITADPSRGGLAMYTREISGQWTADEKDTVYAANATDFEVQYLTLASNPDAQS